MAQSWQWIARSTTGCEVTVGVTTSRRELTTSTVIVIGGTALLVDPSWDPDELAWIGSSLDAAGITVTAGFSTHAHHDHVLWHPRLPNVPRWASVAAVRAAAANHAALITALGPDWSGDLAGEVGSVTGAPGAVLSWAATEITMITHDAHAPGHTALWVPAARVLVAGDMLSDVELPLLEESSVDDYLQGLDALLPFVDEAEVIIPGHGRPATGAERTSRWTADRRYLAGLIAGTDPDDERWHRPGMQQAHRANVRRSATVT
jgi:glyoxylase-like metal-dependent hydrolase (beta-lactamase superfamily II)